MQGKNKYLLACSALSFLFFLINCYSLYAAYDMIMSAAVATADAQVEQNARLMLLVFSASFPLLFLLASILYFKGASKLTEGILRKILIFTSGLFLISGVMLTVTVFFDPQPKGLAFLTLAIMGALGLVGIFRKA